MSDTDDIDFSDITPRGSNAFNYRNEPPGTPPSVPKHSSDPLNKRKKAWSHKRSLSEQIFSKTGLHKSGSKTQIKDKLMRRNKSDDARMLVKRRPRVKRCGSEGGDVESFSGFDSDSWGEGDDACELFDDFSPFERPPENTLNRRDVTGRYQIKRALKRTVKKALNRTEGDGKPESPPIDSPLSQRDRQNRYKRLSDDRRRRPHRASSSSFIDLADRHWNCQLNIRYAKLKDKYNCCVHVYYMDKFVAKTQFAGESSNPVWSKTFQLSINRTNEPIELRIIEKHTVRSDKIIGRAYIALLQGTDTNCHHETSIKYFSLKKGESRELGTIYVDTQLERNFVSSTDDSTVLGDSTYSEVNDDLQSEVTISSFSQKPIYRRISSIMNAKVSLQSICRPKVKEFGKDVRPFLSESFPRIDEGFIFSPLQATRRYLELDGASKSYNIPWYPFFDWPGHRCQELPMVAFKRRYPANFWELRIPKIQWPIEFLLPMSRLEFPTANFVDNLEVGDTVRSSKVIESGFVNIYLIGARGLRSIPQVEMVGRLGTEGRSNTVGGLLPSSVFGGSSLADNNSIISDARSPSIVSGYPGVDNTSPETRAATLVALHWAAKSFTLSPSPQVEFAYGNEKKLSGIVKNNSNPDYLDEFDFQVKNGSPRYIRVTVYDKETQPGTGGILRNSILGETVIDLNELPLEITQKMELQLLKNSNESRLLLFVTITGLVTSSRSPLSDGIQMGGSHSPSISSVYGIPRSRSIISFSMSDDGNKFSNTDVFSDNDEKSDLQNLSPALMNHLSEHYSIKKLFTNLQDIGWMRLKICSAMGLGGRTINGRTEIFCVVDMLNTHLRTQSIIKRKNPTWNRSFVIPLSDIHSTLRISIVECEKNKNEVIAALAIHPLRVDNGGSKWYALKTPNLKGPTKGSILLEFNVVYNKIKSALKCFTPKEPGYRTVKQKESRYHTLKQLQQRLENLKPMLELLRWINQTVEDWMLWKNPFNSILALMGYQLLVYYFQPYFIPLLLVGILIRNRIFKQRKGGNFVHEFKSNKTPIRLASKIEHEIYKNQYEMLEQYASSRSKISDLPSTSGDPELSSLDFGDSVIESNKQLSTGLQDLENIDDFIFSLPEISGNIPEEIFADDKKLPSPTKSEGKKSVRTVRTAFKEKKNQIFEMIENTASTYERIEGLFNWRIPWLSVLFIIVLLIFALIMFFVPLKYIFMTYGFIKFTKAILRPNALRNNELADLISRVPDLVEAAELTEYRPDAFIIPPKGRLFKM